MKRVYVLTVAVAASIVPLFARATTQNSAPPVETRNAEPLSAATPGPEDNFDAKAEVQTLPEQTYGRRGYYEGYVASFGTFRLSLTGSRGMFLASEGSSGRYFFQMRRLGIWDGTETGARESLGISFARTSTMGQNDTFCLGIVTCRIVVRQSLSDT